MKRNKSLVGGEGSGGVIIPDIHYGRDAIAGISIVLQEFANYNGKVSDYKKELPKYHIAKTKIEFTGKPDTILKKIIRSHRNKECKITTADGVKLDYKDYWIHLRKSNTEPIIRIVIEARTKRQIEIIQSEFIKEIKSISR
jgi:phosphomannomutase